MPQRPGSRERATEAIQDWASVFMRRSARDVHAIVRETGLSLSQVGTLFRLHVHGACPISDLGESLELTTAAASHLVDRLVQAGLLERSEDPLDRRVRRVGLSAAGEALLAQIVAARHGWLEQLTRDLSQQQQEEVSRVLGYLAQAARRLESEELGAEHGS